VRVIHRSAAVLLGVACAAGLAIGAAAPAQAAPAHARPAQAAPALPPGTLVGIYQTLAECQVDGNAGKAQGAWTSYICTTAGISGGLYGLYVRGF
jgi:hypothetical protein